MARTKTTADPNASSSRGESPPTTEGAAGAPAAPRAGARLRIRAQRDGYRRAGRAWSRSAVELPADELTAQQLAALEADPRITVERLDA